MTRSQGSLGDEIDGATEQVFEVELHAEKRLRRGSPVQAHEDIEGTVGQPYFQVVVAPPARTR